MVFDNKLYWACGLAQADTVKKLLKLYKVPVIGWLFVNIESKSEENEQTPLHHASEEGHEDIVKLLISAGANIEATNNANMTSLNLASTKGKTSIVKLLIAEGAMITSGKNLDSSPLHLAAANGHRAVISSLIEAGVDIESTQKGYTALHIASKKGNDRLISLLLDNGANINAVGYGGVTPLHLAAQFGSLSATSVLIERGASINSADSHGRTPLHHAIEQSKNEICQLLIVSGGTADIDYEEKNMLTSGDDFEAPSSGDVNVVCAACKTYFEDSLLLLAKGERRVAQCRACPANRIFAICDNCSELESVQQSPCPFCGTSHMWEVQSMLPR